MCQKPAYYAGFVFVDEMAETDRNVEEVALRLREVDSYCKPTNLGVDVGI